MTDILVIDQLPQGVVEIYRDINAIASGLRIPYLVVGATARDLILYHGFGAAIERGTRDIDFGIKIRTWEDFHIMSAGLVTKGFVQDRPADRSSIVFTVLTLRAYRGTLILYLLVLMNKALKLPGHQTAT